jgi:hypothetical protein
MYEQNIPLSFHHKNITAKFYPRGSRDKKWSMDYFKQILKSLNPTYPMDEGGPMSTRKITNLYLLSHIEWTISICTETPQWIIDDWEKVKLQCGII